MSDPNLTINDLNALPEKMRAHAAAKAVGMSSKEFLVAMSGIGVEIKSAQSAVTREVLLTWFDNRDKGAGAPAAAAPVFAEAEPAATPEAEKAPAKKAAVVKASAAKTPATKAADTTAPAKKAPAKKTPAKKAAAPRTAQVDATAGEQPAAQATEQATAQATNQATDQATNQVAESAAEQTATSTDSGESAPAKKTPRKRTPRKTAAQRAAEAASSDTQATDPQATGTQVADTQTTDTQATDARSGNQGGNRRGNAGNTAAKATSQSRPALPEIAIVTGEVGTDDPGNRRRRSNATPSFSPLFLSPDEAGTRPTRSSGAGRSGGNADAASNAAASDTHSGGNATARGGNANARGGKTGSNAGGGKDTASDDAAVDESSQNISHHDDDQSDEGDGGNRRRRRGRRGRGRGRGEGGDDQNTENYNDDNDNDDHDDDTANSATDRGSVDDSDDPTSGNTSGSNESSDSGNDSDGSGSDEDSSDDDSDGSDSSSSGARRRRRRRRRSGGSGSGSDETQSTQDDPPNTEIHEREPRRRSGRGGQAAGGTSADEVQGITGSTRLEAKRQRRRDGREAGRRRQPILSESEFLARREAVDRVMVVREKLRVDGNGIMTQVGVLEDKVLVEHFVTTESARSMVGNVYLGRVQNVLPSMEAAFVDIGRGRNGVLYAGEVNWEAAGLGGRARRIEQALRPGDMVLVQVTKDPVGQKGARLSTQISLAGRFLVYVPDGNSAGISRKLPDTERRRLKAILKDVVPEGSGVIIRTAAEGVSEEEIGRDVDRLASQWTEISEAAAKRTESGSGTPVALYEEPDLLVKVVRDLFNEDFTKLVIQGETSWNTVHSYVSRVAPEMVERLERYENSDVDVFVTHRVDEQLAKALERKVWLPSGGSLVIDRTEAMTVVDVNTGKYTGSGGNLEETVTKNNLEAAEEIVRQLRLRDIGGMIIVDFIDMVLEGNRDLVLRRLTEALGRDRTRHQVSEVTSLGLVQLTRKKLGTGLVEAFSTPCEHCNGRGLIVHADPVHTESHNADEPGTRRGGRRRGGKDSESGTEPAATKQAPRKDGPAPGAHPAVLAMRSDEHDDHGDHAEGVDTTADSKSAVKADDAKTAPAESGSEKARSTDAATDTAAGAEVAAAAAADASANAQPAAESSDSTGSSRPSRRRRATRKAPSTAPANDGAAEDTAAAPAAEAVADVSDAAPAAEAAANAAPAANAADDASGQSGRRPRRRSGRREAGAAATDAVTQAEAEAAAAKVEAASLAEAPTVVAAEPRKRPARRRATRSATSPEGA